MDAETRHAAAPSPVSPIRTISSLRLADVPVAGGKGANLGELTAAGIPVPPGFVVTASAYLETMEQAGVRSALVARARGLDVDDGASLAAASEELRAMVGRGAMPRPLRTDVIRAYHFGLPAVGVGPFALALGTAPVLAVAVLARLANRLRALGRRREHGADA